MEALNAQNEQQRATLMQTHVQHIKKHMRDLGSKNYWDKLEVSPEFVIMFVPGESAFSAALEESPDLLQAGWDQRVILATPTTLMATIMAVAYSWKQEAMAQNAKEAAQLGSDLYDRLSTFIGYMQDISGGLNRAIGSYNKAVGSLESRVLPKARQFKSLKLASESKPDLPVMPPVEASPRPITAKEGEEELVYSQSELN